MGGGTWVRRRTRHDPCPTAATSSSMTPQLPRMGGGRCPGPVPTPVSGPLSAGPAALHRPPGLRGGRGRRGVRQGPTRTGRAAQRGCSAAPPTPLANSPAPDAVCRHNVLGRKIDEYPSTEPSSVNRCYTRRSWILHCYLLQRTVSLATHESFTLGRTPTISVR